MLKFPPCPRCYAPDPHAQYLEGGHTYSQYSGWSTQKERFKFICTRCEYVWACSIEDVQKAQSSIDDSWRVHNHGTERDPGISCQEYRINGKLIGHCLLKEAEMRPIHGPSGHGFCYCGEYKCSAMYASHDRFGNNGG